MSDLDEAIGHLGAALVQSIDSDDQIIMGHVREAHDLIKRARAVVTTDAQSVKVTDAMVERAWAAIVGSDVAPICFQASIIRADLKTGLEAVLAAQLPAAPVDIPDDVRATEDMTLAMNARQAAINEMMAAPVETTSAPEYDDKCEYYPYFEMLWKWFEERRGKEDMRANAIDGLSVADFKSMLDEHEAELTAPPSSSAGNGDDLSRRARELADEPVIGTEGRKLLRQMATEIEDLRHDIDRHIQIATDIANEPQPAQELRLAASRLTDIITMLDAPDAYNREYIAAVCRSVLSSLTRPELGGSK